MATYNRETGIHKKKKNFLLWSINCGSLSKIKMKNLFFFFFNVSEPGSFLNVSFNILKADLSPLRTRSLDELQLKLPSQPQTPLAEPLAANWASFGATSA